VGVASRLKRECKQAEVVPWTPFVAVAQLHIKGVTLPTGYSGFDLAFQNSRYLVLIRKILAPAPFGEGLHLSIKRHDQAPVHDWRDIQRIKNELLDKECEAVELYPADSRLVDGANQYHLWAFPNFTFPFGFKERMVLDVPLLAGAVQRPFED
jgi:hypothetical protein